jgi:cytochrome c556
MHRPSRATLGSAVTAITLGTALLASACTQKAPEPAPAPAAAAPEVLKPPVPLVDFMRASVEIPADGIWAAQASEKLSDKDWLLADQDSVALASAATLIAMGGTGKNDPAWAANADWQAWTRELQKTALALRAAAKAKDQAGFNDIADKLTANCEACHAKYRPETPSDGVARYPFYPVRTLPK